MRGSEAGRAVICPASLVLPRVPRTPSEKRARAANWGTLVHHWKETGQTDPSWADPRDTATLEKKLVLSGIDRETWWPSGEGRHEVTFALHLYNHELRLYDEKLTASTRDTWKLGFGPKWLTGTIDWLGNADPTIGYVDDLKTGAWPVDVKTSAQLRAYSLVPWVAAGCPMAWDGIVSITAWPKYRLDGQPSRTSHWLGALDLLETLEDLRHAEENPQQVTPTDEGCKFCDCKPLCPAHVDADTELEELDDDYCRRCRSPLGFCQC